MNKRVAIALLCAAVLSSCSFRGQRFRDFKTGTPIAQDDVLILGFMGGRDSWNNTQVGVGRFAQRLRSLGLTGVHVETVENRKRALALEFVRRVFDRDLDGVLNEQERRSARIILYGQSFGGAAVVKFARDLQNIGLPVLLTVQVDSIGRNDEVIPANVAAAANLFQRDGRIIRGPGSIRPEDPRATHIVGNFRYSYRDRFIDISSKPWYKKIVRHDHTRMDLDPAVWQKVEELILSSLASVHQR